MCQLDMGNSVGPYCEAGIGMHAFATFYILHLLADTWVGYAGCAEFSFLQSFPSFSSAAGGAAGVSSVRACT